MSEPFAMWGHVPVYVRKLDGEFVRDFVIGSHHPPATVDEKGVSIIQPIQLITRPGYEEIAPRYERQAKEAIDLAVTALPDMLNFLPKERFYVALGRNRQIGVQINDVIHPPSVVNEISLIEPVAFEEVWKRRGFRREVHRVCASGPISSLEAEENPYPVLFDQFISKLPDAWEDWLKWRRTLRGKLRWTE